MTAVELVTKVCKDCGEEKPGGEFYRNKNTRDGLASYCKPCSIERSKQYQRRLRERMGDAAYRNHKRRITEASRAKPEVRERQRLGVRVQDEALRQLRDLHRDEYEHLLAVVWSEAERGEFE